MKFLLVPLFLATLLLLWQYRRRAAQTAAQKNRLQARKLPPQPMVTCAVCGVHMPLNQAHIKHKTAYCDKHGPTSQS